MEEFALSLRGKAWMSANEAFNFILPSGIDGSYDEGSDATIFYNIRYNLALRVEWDHQYTENGHFVRSLGYEVFDDNQEPPLIKRG